MKELFNVSLREYTSIRIGGIAKRMMVPESVDELLTLMDKDMSMRFLGGGTNLLINDRAFETVVDMRAFAPSIEKIGNGQFKTGASVRLQTLINCINQQGYGGIEYLYSVPGLVGGAVVMNAGRGRSHNKSISDHIISVDVIRNGELMTIAKDVCGFEYRSSIFKNSSDIVVSVLFDFPMMSVEESSNAKRDRIKLCQQSQDTSFPNFGTVFMTADPRIMAIAKKLRVGNKRVHFSKKTANWLVNEGDGTFKDAIGAIKKIEFLHKVLGKECKREVIVWE